MFVLFYEVDCQQLKVIPSSENDGKCKQFKYQNGQLLSIICDFWSAVIHVDSIWVEILNTVVTVKQTKQTKSSASPPYFLDSLTFV